jgi:hypothetical protein
MSASYPGSDASGPPAVRADRAVHEACVTGAHRLGPEPEPFGEARPQTLEEHVGLIGEAEHNLSTPRVRERHGKRTLAGVDGEEHRAFAVPERRSPCAPVIARVGSFDLHDVGPERREDLGAVGAGDRRRDVDNVLACEGEARHRANHPLAARPSVAATGRETAGFRDLRATGDSALADLRSCALLKR